MDLLRVARGKAAVHGLLGRAPPLEVLGVPLAGDAAASPGVLKSLELAALKQLASAHQGNRAELAQKLGISERSLYRKPKALGA